MLYFNSGHCSIIFMCAHFSSSKELIVGLLNVRVNVEEVAPFDSLINNNTEMRINWMENIINFLSLHRRSNVFDLIITIIIMAINTV